MNISRRVEPEWLDELPADDPRALRSRRDLRRINALMMNVAIVAGEFDRLGNDTSPLTIAEIGAGDGTFMLRLAKKTANRWRDAHVVLVDRQDIVGPATRGAIASLGWKVQSVTADVFDWLSRPTEPRFDVIVANLFLHHFGDAGLRSLLALAAARSSMFVACEPRRSGMALAGSHLLGAIGCNDVSRHDATISVRAGFAGAELSVLWPAPGAWTLRESARGIFSHCFVAARVDSVACP